MMQLLAPYLSPVVQELFELIAAGKAWTMGHVPNTIKEIVAAIQVTCTTVFKIFLLLSLWP